jgi:cytoskeletal protein CcmA (bactofilin family)
MAGLRLPFGGTTGGRKASEKGEGNMKTRKSSGEKGVTLIAARTEISGDVHFVNQIYINGHIRGNVTADADSEATVVVGDEGAVTGEIRVPNVVVNGRVEGNVYAMKRMELAQNAEVKGNVYYKLIEMQLGAMVDGQLVHDDTLGAETLNVHKFPDAPESVANAD